MTQRDHSKLHTSSLRSTTIIITLLLAVSYVNAQFVQKQITDPCTSKIKCNECIQTPKCAWCMNPDFGEKPRCFQPSQSSYDICSEAFTINPDNTKSLQIYEELTVTRGTSSAGGTLVSGGSMYANGSYSSSSSGRSSSEYGGSSSARGSSSNSAFGAGGFSSSGGSSSASGYSSSGSGKIVQINPQRASLNLRINEPFIFDFNYAQAVDYPVDLYYLMDLSKSMEDDKEKLSTLGDLLATEMRSITSNFRLGFGSFVDKVLMPYVSTIPKKLKEPCDKCAAPYGFLSHMSLSEDSAKFSTEVKNAKVSGNLDAPEGGFDAIMQAIVCREQIGWRKAARRLLVFSTDAGFHYAGDGKLGGVIAPNDGECHMDSSSKYTHSEIQDYPSISQINYKVKENSINLIFAVTESQISVYNKLAKHVEGSSSAILSNDSSNIVELIKNEYQKITSVIEMKDNATSFIKIDYYSSCLKGEDKEIETSKCEGLKVGDIVKFKAKITALKCPENPADWKQTIKINPVGIDEELVIDVDLLCSCPCEQPGHQMFEKNSPKCQGHGDFTCGICDCGDTFFGRKCECSNTDFQTIQDSGSCRKGNETFECSGRGTCVCGVCECEKRSNNEMVTGKYCECDNFSCERHYGKICSGPDHGFCDCGNCHCKPNWKGSACECPSTDIDCMGPDGKVCSDHGVCECGKCVCTQTKDGRYSGKFCEKCPTCAGRCAEFKECVQCLMYKTGPLTEQECADNCTIIPKAVDKIVFDNNTDEYKCSFYDNDDCKFTYKYYDEYDVITGKTIVHIEAQQDRECPAKVFMLGIILMVIGAIVLIGLALLVLWKVLTTIHDRREFARFEKEREMARWDTGENPIYKQATSTFKNPTYSGK